MMHGQKNIKLSPERLLLLLLLLLLLTNVLEIVSLLKIIFLLNLNECKKMYITGAGIIFK